MDSFFADGGPLAGHIPGYRSRAQQLEMAQAVEKAIRESASLVCEAGTGTGKTLAYLVPALLSGGKVIISTGTKTLQDQLFHRDLPLVRKALDVPVTVALLKGRANYVCRHHLERSLEQPRAASREEAAHLRSIVRFARRTATGDRAELSEVPEESLAWSHATSTRENCLGQSCRHYDDCFVIAARRNAQAADVIVVNHHLFFADVMLKDEGMAELLPACNTVIFDEAHQLPETATPFFGESVSTGQLMELARDARAEVASGARDVAGIAAGMDALETAARELRLALPYENLRFSAGALRARPRFVQAVQGLDRALGALADGLGQIAERSEGLEKCAARAQALHDRVQRWRGERDDGFVRWAEVFSQSLALNATPLSVAEVFRGQLEGRPRAWIFTSATLAVSGDFGLYRSEMGLEEARCAAWESPFDYPNNALLYVPRNLPEPNSPEHTQAVIKAALPVIEASAGRAFLLFTSLRAMRLAHEMVREALAARGLRYPLLVQGEGSRSELLERFRSLGNAVLLGSATFWEGIDVRGDALSLVVIDKLPFAAPDDPVLAARLEALEQAGGNPFLQYQLPRAVISLKQGAGRLIRDETDRGVLMICDPRLFSKAYGRRILPSLPPMRLCRELEEVRRFFAA